MTTNSDSLPVSTEVVKKSLQLLEREHKSGQIDDETYERERAKYLSIAAELIEKDSDDIQVVADKEPKGKKSFRKIAIWSLIIGAVVIAAFVVLSSNKSDRQGDQPLSGGVVGSNNDLLAQAATAQQQGDLAEALKLYEKVLDSDPKNIDALSSRGWSLYLASIAVSESNPEPVQPLVDESLKSLDRALEIDSTYGPARAWRGVVRFRANNDAQGAIEDFDAYLANSDNDGMGDLVQTVRNEAAQSLQK